MEGVALRLLFVCISAAVPFIAQAQSYSRVKVVQYHDDTTSWVIGQVAGQSTDGVMVAETGYDAQARPNVFRSFGRTLQTVGYASDGTVSSTTDGSGNITLYGDWKRGVPRSVQYADGTSGSAAVDDSGWIRSITDENGFSTQYDYDPMGRRSRTDYPAGDSTGWLSNVASFVQNPSSAFGLPAGHWVGTETTGNYRKTSYFDALWRPILISEHDSSKPTATQRYRRFAYDADGRVTFTSFDSASSTETSGTWKEYDALGRLTSSSRDSEAGVLTELTEYLSGHRVRTTPPRGNATVTTYMSFDRPDYSLPVHRDQQERAVTEIQRDSLGNPLSITRRDQDGSSSQTRRYIYDAARMLCRVIEPETGSALFFYDAAGNIQWSANGVADTSLEGCGYAQAGAGQKVERTYDQRNRLHTMTFPDGLGNQVHTYTPDGLPKEVRTQNGGSSGEVVNSYSYNRRRLLAGETLAVRGVALSLGYVYATDGSLASQVYPSGRSVDYQPNSLGQSTRVGQFATSVSYYPNGDIASFLYGNGVHHTTLQNGRRTTARMSDVGPSSVLDLSYGYDANDNVSAVLDAATGGQSSHVMSYDGLDRLLTADSPMFGGDQRASFTYDAVDNLRSFKIGDRRSYVYGYSARNQLETVSRVSDGAAVIGIAYDPQGNVSNRNGVLHQFDVGNRLRAVVGRESYSYDGHGRRVEAVSSDAGTILSFYDIRGVLRYQDNGRASKKSEYFYLGNRMVARADVSTLPPPQSAPTLSVPSSSSTGTYVATWSSVAGADRYRLEERLNGGEWSQVIVSASTNWTASSKGNGTYGYRVSACNAGGCSSTSSEGQVVVLVAPTSPTLQAPSLSTDGNYTVSWNATPTAQTFRLEEQQADGASWSVVQDSYLVAWQAAAKPDGTYRYRVQACNASGCGGSSALVAVTVLHPPTHVPALVGPAVSTTGTFVISWTSGAGVTGYTVQERVGDGAWSGLGGTAATAVSINGKPNGSYGYRVSSCNSSGCGNFSAEFRVIVLHVPDAPQASAPALSTNGSYVVGWTPMATATSYRLEEQLSGSGWNLLYGGVETAFGVGGRPNGTHYYRAQACNSSGCGSYSAAVGVLVRLPPADAPGISSPASSTTGLFSVNWNGVATAETYQLEEQVNGGGWTLQYEGPLLSRYQSQRPSATYQYRVRGCNTSSCGPYSVTTQTVVAINRIPLEFKVRYSATGYPQQTSRYYFYWNPIVGATRYEINTIKQQTITVQATAPNPHEITMGGPPMHFGDSYRIRSCDAGSCSDWSEWVKHASL